MKIKDIFKNKFKNSVEWSKNYYLNSYQLIQQNELEAFSEQQNIFNKNNPCNIYFVIRRAKVTVNKNYCRVGSDFVEVEFIIHDKDKVIPLKVCIGIPNDLKEVKLVTEYPFVYFSIQSDTKNIIGGKASVFLDRLQRTQPHDFEMLDLEILYIGKSLDDTNNLSTIRRLLNHSKIQTIYKEEMTNRPDTDIWILLCSFNSQNLTVFGFPSKNKNLNEEFKKVKKLTNPKNLEFSKEHKTNILEAGLINYFQPIYNETFKDNFPNRKHISYSEALKKDLNSLVIELDTSEIKWFLHTQTTKRKIVHTIQYDFLFEEGRFSIYDLSKDINK